MAVYLIHPFREQTLRCRSGQEIRKCSKGLQTNPMREDWKIEPLRKLARSIHVPYDRKTTRIQLIENIKVSTKEGKNKQNV